MTWTHEDILLEAKRILDAAKQRNVLLRLFGGVAVRLRCPSATHRQLQRTYADIDAIGLKKQSRDINALFVDLGYTPRKIFNALQGEKRLIFNDLQNERRVDIFLDVFKMCHRFEFANRLGLDEMTIPLADLLATKLQVVQMTEREYRDIIALLYDHEVGDSDLPETINGAYLAKLCADDWGIYQTFSISLSNVRSALGNYELDGEYQELVRKRIQALEARIENAPKTIRWKIRAGVGEKKKWYELPEQDKEVVDSSVTSVTSN